MCNCRNRDACPMNGKCWEEWVILYQATVEQDDGSRSTYVGLTETSFKARYTNHKASFNHKEKRNSTELSKHIWLLKEKGINFRTSWKILRHARPYNSISQKCNLCITEKLFIICYPELASLNKRNQLVSTCRHQAKHFLDRT